MDSNTTRTPKATANVADPRQWLEHIAAPRRSTVANWFHFAVRNGATHATQVLLTVRQTCERRQNADALQVLGALRDDLNGALAYAQHVLDYERLPWEQRQRVKAERSLHFLKEAMASKPATPAQLSFLQTLGYTGHEPANRAEASAIIDVLRQQKGGAR